MAVQLSVVFSVILSVLQGRENLFSSPGHGVTLTFYVLNVIFTCVFLFDMVVKWMGHGLFTIDPPGYFRSFSNWIDFLCNVFLIVAWITGHPLYNALRAVRLVRLANQILSTLCLAHTVGVCRSMCL